MENRYREGMQNIYINVRAAERMIVERADAEEDENHATVMRAVAMAYGTVAELVANEIRDADDEEEEEEEVDSND